jgi:glycosyltransferase involved in cell wall biosynthesis
MRTQYRRADRVITVTEELGRWLEVETGRSDVEVVPNGANTDLFAPGAEVPRGLPSRYAVFVGALAEWQGLPTVLDAVSEAAWPPDVGLVIVGDGALREMAEEYARTDPLVTYLGRLPYAEVPGVLGGALTALVPMNNLRGRSDTGLSPLKLYEALACGVPVVATDFPGQAELVRDAGAGIVVPPSDAGALAAAVARLAADPESARAMGASGMAVVRERHSWAVRSRQTAEIVRSLLPRRGSGR